MHSNCTEEIKKRHRQNCAYTLYLFCSKYIILGQFGNHHPNMKTVSNQIIIKHPSIITVPYHPQILKARTLKSLTSSPYHIIFKSSRALHHHPIRSSSNPQRPYNIRHDYRIRPSSNPIITLASTLKNRKQK